MIRRPRCRRSNTARRSRAIGRLAIRKQPTGARPTKKSVPRADTPGIARVRVRVRARADPLQSPSLASRIRNMEDINEAGDGGARVACAGRLRELEPGRGLFNSR